MMQPNRSAQLSKVAVPKALVIFAVMVLAGFIGSAQENHSSGKHPVAGLGKVSFPTSCNASAQNLMSRAVALLHSFGYEEARLAFAEAAKADPS
jgi:hypothetical protein